MAVTACPRIPRTLDTPLKPSTTSEASTDRLLSGSLPCPGSTSRPGSVLWNFQDGVRAQPPRPPAARGSHFKLLFEQSHGEGLALIWFEARGEHPPPFGGGSRFKASQQLLLKKWLQKSLSPSPLSIFYILKLEENWGTPSPRATRRFLQGGRSHFPLEFDAYGILAAPQSTRWHPLVCLVVLPFTEGSQVPGDLQTLS